jgi:hypothetical protein
MQKRRINAVHLSVRLQQSRRLHTLHQYRLAGGRERRSGVDRERSTPLRRLNLNREILLFIRAARFEEFKKIILKGRGNLLRF